MSMPIFLLQYDRSASRLMNLRSFEDSDRQGANDARLELELKLHRSHLKHEVVLLDAPNEGALRMTHRRYFIEDLPELADSPLVEPR